MPQANITYDTRYNKGLVNTLREMETKNHNYNQHQYHPSPMGFRNAASFHAPETVRQVPRVKITGGVAPSKYILNGNSPAYPPLNMNAGLAVSSGGGRNPFAGVDGAVSGGKFRFSDLTKGAKDVLDMGKSAAQLAAVAAPLMAASSGGVQSAGASSGGLNIGKALKKVGKATKQAVGVAKQGKEAYDLYKSVMGDGTEGGSLLPRAENAYDIKKINAFSRKIHGGSALSDAFKVIKQVAPLALPMMMGAGHSCSAMGDKVAMIEKAMKKLKGGSFWKSFGKGFKKGFTGTLDVAKDIAPIAIPLMMAAGRKEHGKGFNMGKFLERKGRTLPAKKVQGVSLNDAIESTKAIGSKAVKEVKKRGAKALKEVAADLVGSVKAAAVKAVKGGGRSARAAIVKKVMADKGLKMIQASKYVKEHGLY